MVALNEKLFSMWWESFILSSAAGRTVKTTRIWRRSAHARLCRGKGRNSRSIQHNHLCTKPLRNQLPLPFLSIASQKQFIGFYHMGVYADPELLAWFQHAYGLLGLRKLDMGKSCIRFKKWEEMPFELLGDLVSRVTVSDWIATYESKLKR